MLLMHWGVFFQWVVDFGFCWFLWGGGKGAFGWFGCRGFLLGLFTSWKKRGLIGWGFLVESNCILRGREAFIHYFSSHEKKRLNRNVCRPMWSVLTFTMIKSIAGLKFKQAFSFSVYASKEVCHIDLFNIDRYRWSSYLPLCWEYSDQLYLIFGICLHPSVGFVLTHAVGLSLCSVCAIYIAMGASQQLCIMQCSKTE